MERHNLADYELIKQYISGDSQCLEALINRHKNKVYSYIVMNVRDRELAEDLFQDTFIKVVRSIDSGTYTDDGKFLPWVMRIAHNLVIDYYRRAKHMPTISTDAQEYNPIDLMGARESSAEDKLVRRQQIAELKQYIRQLPSEQRDVVLYRCEYDMSFKEIAEYTGVSINTALGRMRYAIINLRKMMKVAVEL
ncbi:MAG: sigma-70 family RNA polymerase sigma factor [Salinivirgaceae bacterium]|nr:sigma-70 family RNA polymerase sigma factor [Salinivirgaceae bacterium]